jgi:hypothetical protein
MIELEIPEAAFNAGAQAENSDDSISLAAPLIVAAELRRLIAKGETNAGYLRLRADELEQITSKQHS